MRLVIAVVGAALSCLAGCAQRGTAPEPVRPIRTELTAAEAEERAEVVRRDPRTYLRTVYLNCTGLAEYTLVFTRQERRGLLRTLTPPERIQVWFRRAPFSVRMKWLDEDVKYGESVFVRGQFDDQVRFVTRRWSPPLLPPPQVNRVAVNVPAMFGEARRPVTDFGLELLMERTLAAFTAARDDGLLVYEGVVTHAGTGRRAHRLRLEYNPNKFPVPTQELYIDVATDLPLGTVLRLANGQLDASYTYAELDTTVRLTENDFLLPQEREQRDRKGRGGKAS